jgi:short-subunit dehydrogenase
MGAIGAVEESSLAQAQEVFNVNVFGVMRMTKAVLPLMRTQGRGRIINLSSVVGVLPSPYMAAYAASKHGIEGFSESLDHEVREHGVRALLVEPAYTITGFDAPVIVAKVISRRRPTRSRSCATPLVPWQDAQAYCAASLPPGSSTSRSASSTG